MLDVELGARGHPTSRAAGLSTRTTLRVGAIYPAGKTPLNATSTTPLPATGKPKIAAPPTKLTLLQVKTPPGVKN